MASAQVMQNSAAGSSRKQGHLEAGKRRLEEFRKKKAEGKAKKAVSTGQLLSSDIDHLDKLPQDRGNVNDRATCDPDNNTTIELTRANTGSEMNAVGSSTSTKSVLSNVTEAVSINHDGTSHSGLQSKEQSRDDGAGSYKNFQLTRLMDDYYSQGWDKNHLHSERDPERKVSDKSVMRQGNVHSVYPNSKFDVKDNNSTLYSGDGLQEDKEQDKFEIVQSNPFYVPDKRSGFRSTGSFSNISLEETASTSYEDTYALQQRRPDTKNHDGAKGLSGGGKLTNDLTSHHHDINSEHWRFAESPVDSASTLKSSSTQFPSSSSTSVPTATWRARPSFLDFLNVPRPSSVSHSSFSEPANTEPTVPFGSSKFYGAEVQQLPSHKSDDKYFQGDASLASPHSFGRKESDLNFSASKSEDKLRKEVVDGDRKGMKDFSSSTKDEDFAALEQHIEDLTQEKFSLQRALESSRTLAESLASENSSLTESYNQQGKVVNELKSEMERLYEEIRAQLIELEAVKMESTNAQLECSAADERAKILASEVIGLEEKALRLRSNELKLEKQLENLNAEIGSYKRRLSSLEKERYDFQSTIEALQEEKKLLLSKVRKTTSNDRVDTQRTSAPKKDSFTSTEDLEIENSTLIDGGDSMEMMSSPTVDTLQSNDRRTSPSSNVSMFSHQSETGKLFVQDAPGMIPPEQLRTIDNINSLISELALEKEELIRALRVQSTDYSKLKDTNKELSQKLETQTQRLEFLAAQHMASESMLARPLHAQSIPETTGYTDEGDEVVERVLGWIMKLFPGGPSKRRTSKLL